MSTNISTRTRGKGWVFQVTALCIVLGMLLALALRTQRQAVSEGIPNRWPALRTEFINLKQQNAKLQKDLADYKTRYEEMAREQASGSLGIHTMERVLNETQLLAGTLAARGPGVIVTLDDSPKKEMSETRPDVVENYIVHDSDIRSVTNELFAAGAEAISVNGQRLIANSSIRCVGPVVLVNSVQIARPYVIKAIGAPEALQTALELPGGVADGLFLLDMIEVKKQPDLVVPAYKGSTRLNWAQPVRQTGKKG